MIPTRPTGGRQPSCLPAIASRCLCCDETEFTADDAAEVSRFVAKEQIEQISRGLEKVLTRLGSPRQILLSGAGTFLAKNMIAAHCTLRHIEQIELARVFGAAAAEAACAFAIACLAAERQPF